jgi:GrpB-like predicted nucleotidyltransferase (UPF0157 family)
MTAGGDAPITIVSYDSAWPDLFERERAAIADTIGDWIVGGIEHVGSTAVPGLAAKPVIDVMVGVESLETSRTAVSRLATIGYLYAPYRADVMHWLCKPSVALRTHHLHLVPFGSELWSERLSFRDYLRSHPHTAAEYASLKRMLADRHRDDREAYTEAKGPFVARVVALARGESSPARR